MPRAARPATLIPGLGGYMMIRRGQKEDIPGEAMRHPEDMAEFYANAFLLDVLRWRVRHRYIWAPATHSGSNGSLNRIIVAQDWEFDAELTWNAAEVQAYDTEALGFMEEILLGNRENDWNVSILFQIGDPLAYPDILGKLGLDRRAGLHGPYALLEYGEMVNDGTGRGGQESVVRAIVHGVGNGLLRSVRGSEVITNKITEPIVAPAPAGAEG